MNRIAYSYRVELKHTGHFYYGIKYSKFANPKDFWVNYFTSSKTIKNLITNFGKDSFQTQILNTYTLDNISKLFEEEYYLIDSHKDNVLCLNGNNGGKVLDNNVGRRLKDADGLSSYDKAGIKLSLFIENNPCHKNKLIFNLTNWRTDEDKVISAKNKYNETLDVLKENGLTLREELSLKMLGDNNPSKLEENRLKISQGNKLWYINNPDAAQKLKESITNSKIKTDEDGLTLSDKHSLYMLENNPTKGTVWANNGEINIRCYLDDIPEGYQQGRIVKNKMTRISKCCPHCGKEGKGPNMSRYHFDNCKKIKGIK